MHQSLHMEARQQASSSRGCTITILPWPSKQGEPGPHQQVSGDHTHLDVCPTLTATLDSSGLSVACRCSRMKEAALA